MLCKKTEQRELEKYLSEPISKWGWDPTITAEQAQRAKEALRRTLESKIILDYPPALH